MNNFKLKFLIISLLKNQNRGLTLLELLIVIVIMGILSAIALPSFLRMVNRAKEVEAIEKVKTIMTKQQGYYLENTVFTSETSNLDAALSMETSNYNYQIVVVDRNKIVILVAIPKNSQLPYYGGGVYFKRGEMQNCGPWPARTIQQAIATYYARCP